VEAPAVSSPSERGAVAAARPDLPSLAPAPSCPVAVVRTPQGWAVIWPEGEDPVGSLVEGFSLADLLVEERGDQAEPDRTARRSARGPAAVDADTDPRDARIAALERTVAQLEHALAARVATERAIGVLAERTGVSPRTAFESLRRDARSSGRPVHELAREVLESLAGPADAEPEQAAAPRPVVSGVPSMAPARSRPPFPRRVEQHARPRSGAAGDGRS
jgi:ANTAR domain